LGCIYGFSGFPCRWSLVRREAAKTPRLTRGHGEQLGLSDGGIDRWSLDCREAAKTPRLTRGHEEQQSVAGDGGDDEHDADLFSVERRRRLPGGRDYFTLLRVARQSRV
jgi:hypothetical protein